MIIDNAKGYDSQKLTIFNYKFFSWKRLYITYSQHWF